MNKFLRRISLLLKPNKGKFKREKTFYVGSQVAEYKVIPRTEQQKELMDKNGVNYEFTAFSVGNEKGQAAIFPIDDFGEEKAKLFAKLFADMLNNQKDD